MAAIPVTAHFGVSVAPAHDEHSDKEDDGEDDTPDNDERHYGHLAGREYQRGQCIFPARICVRHCSVDNNLEMSHRGHCWLATVCYDYLQE